jgi:hypothetical protein
MANPTFVLGKCLGKGNPCLSDCPLFLTYIVSGELLVFLLVIVEMSQTVQVELPQR